MRVKTKASPCLGQSKPQETNWLAQVRLKNTDSFIWFFQKQARGSLRHIKRNIVSLASLRSGRRKVSRRKLDYIRKLFPELVSIARWLDCLPGTYNTLGVRPEIPALKRQKQEDLKIKAILNLKQFKVSLECPRFSFKRGLSHQDSAQTPRNFTRVWKDLKLNSC